MEEIIAYLKESITDGYFSRKEKKSLKVLIRNAAITSDQLNQLSGKIHAIAKETINDQNYGFIIEWMEQANRALWQAAKNQSIAHFSPGDQCRNTIIRCINSAREDLDICVFTISDNRISDALIEAYDNGIKIRIITDNDKAFDRGSDIAQFARHGLSVKVDNTSNHMHHKFMLSDRLTLLTGSYNWTRSAADYNHENILVTNEALVVSAYQKEFSILWKKMTPY